MKRKRRRIHCVCSCTHRGRICFVDAIVLNQMVKDGEREIQHESNTRKAGRMALELGILCEKKGWHLRAIDIWKKGIGQLAYHDQVWGWRRLPSTHDRIGQFIAEEEALELGRRIDAVWKEIGHEELAEALRQATEIYWDIWLSRYGEWVSLSFIEEREKLLGISEPTATSGSIR